MYRSYGISLTSRSDEDNPTLMLSFGTFSRWIALPWSPIRPKVEKCKSVRVSGETVWYERVTPRRYGFTIDRDILIVYFGLQSYDSSVDQDWAWLIPWNQWKFIDTRVYDLNGEFLTSESDIRRDLTVHEWIKHLKSDAVPKRCYDFADYDGETISARTYIEEREWHRGTGWFSWLKYLYEPKIKRSLDIRFSNETGPRKGSWKGGTIGHSIEMLPGELHEDAFRRYCLEHDMTYRWEIPCEDSSVWDESRAPEEDFGENDTETQPMDESPGSR